MRAGIFIKSANDPKFETALHKFSKGMNLTILTVMSRFFLVRGKTETHRGITLRDLLSKGLRDLL